MIAWGLEELWALPICKDPVAGQLRGDLQFYACIVLHGGKAGTKFLGELKPSFSICLSP